MDQIIPLELTFSHEGLQKSLFPTLIRHDNGLTLMDRGYPGFLPLLEEAIRPLIPAVAGIRRRFRTEHADLVVGVQDAYAHPGRVCHLADGQSHVPRLTWECNL